MKVLFLDHDGPIVLSNSTRFNEPGLDSEFESFDKQAVRILNEIITETNCEIVTSSDWRHNLSLEQLGELYTIRGIIKRPISVTGYKPGKGSEIEECRAWEIQLWLAEHPDVIGCGWCAVDDMDLAETFGPISGNSNGMLSNFVQTPNSKKGITEEGVKEKIIKILNNK